MTSNDRHILAVTERGDLHAQAVAAALKTRGVSMVQLNLREVGHFTSTYRTHRGQSSVEISSLPSLNEITCVWWRRPWLPEFPEPAGNDTTLQQFREAEFRALLQGALWSCPVSWVNDPGSQVMAARKLVQLSRALECGLAIPKSMATSNPQDAEEFIKSVHGRTVVKRIGTSAEVFTTTQLVTDEMRTSLGRVASCPVLLQEFIEPECDIRLVYMGGHLTGAAVASTEGIGIVDSRLDLSVSFTPWHPPSEIQTKAHQLMTSLGLVFGVLDFRIGTDGNLYFLEVNPQGQFAYLDIKCGTTLVEEFASFLASKAERT